MRQMNIYRNLRLNQTFECVCFFSFTYFSLSILIIFLTTTTKQKKKKKAPEIKRLLYL